NAPTLYLYNSTVDDNGRDGINIHTYTGDASYLYQYVVAINSHVDDNTRYGIYADNTLYAHFDSGPSQLIQLFLLYGYDGDQTTVDYNGADGIHIYTNSYDGYFFNGLVVNSVAAVNSDISHNNGD